jgi:hypothetical protein
MSVSTEKIVTLHDYFHNAYKMCATLGKRRQ